ncbi:MAG: hypothetical protein JSV63_01140 [Candidatus Aenigmatarchaeota archaeon]|nr:MAG: hypothetical protein JSV63_01140 [Candidatus Aenigmarchaeota archaeon]
MSLITDILEVFSGRLRFHLFFEGKPAVDLVLTPREIVVEIKNPIVALEMGFHQIGHRNKLNSYIIKMIKAAGYKMKIKYKMLEFEI